jgi:hypothetical protein
MGEFVHETQHEFWRPPSPAIAKEDEVVVPEASPAMAETCPRCGTEFLLGSRFCHSCGGRRPQAVSSTARADAAAITRLWERAVSRMRSLLAGIPWNKAAIPWNKIKSLIRKPAWIGHLNFQYLHFHEIKRRVGLQTAPLIAFVIGLGCVAGALLVGLFTAKTLVDWQAIQFYRVEWLLAATAAFVAGILLSRRSDN